MPQLIEAFGQTIEFPDGMSHDEIAAAIKRNALSIKPKDDKPAVVAAGESINSIPRQLGLTARYALEGPAQAAQIVTEPIRAVTDRVWNALRPKNLSDLVTDTPKQGKTAGELASGFADWIGLPKPESATERVVGDAARLMSGGAATMGAGSVASALPGLAGRVGTVVAQSPVQQLAGAAGAGVAGGASREAGGNPLMQFGASLLGGVAAGAAVPAIGSAASKVATRVGNIGMSQADMDMQISAVLQRAGVDWSQLPQNVRSSLRNEIGSAMKAGYNLDAAAVARLADFRRIGATPTQGMLSLDPVQITREQNLARMAANSSDGELHGLPGLLNQNNATFIRNLNDAGATSGDAFRAGQQAIGSIQGKDSAWRKAVSGLYTSAREMPGGDIPLQRAPVVNAIWDSLAKENKAAYLPDSITNMLNTISQGQITRNGQVFPVPFTANVLDNLMTDIATAQRSTSDGNVKAALSIARKALDSVEMAPIKNEFGNGLPVTQATGQRMAAADAASGNFMDALNRARGEARQRFGWQESSRPVSAALDGAAPDNFIKRFVIGGTLDDARAVAAEAGPQESKNAILAYLKERALNGAADEVGKFSPSAYNKALSAIGERKLGVFFSQEEVDQLRAVGRASSYQSVQPVGSAVNNSNSGALLLGRGYDALRAVAGKVPFGQQMLLDPIKNIDIALSTRRAQKLLPGLLAEQERAPTGGLGAGLALTGGLLSAP